MFVPPFSLHVLHSVPRQWAAAATLQSRNRARQAMDHAGSLVVAVGRGRPTSIETAIEAEINRLLAVLDDQPPTAELTVAVMCRQAADAAGRTRAVCVGLSELTAVSSSPPFSAAQAAITLSYLLLRTCTRRCSCTRQRGNATLSARWLLCGVSPGFVPRRTAVNPAQQSSATPRYSVQHSLQPRCNRVCTVSPGDSRQAAPGLSAGCSSVDCLFRGSPIPYTCM
ncbi:hypothetical protein J3F83DRAFT_237631 [Trichoderma novae-zelandiae]